MKGLELAKAYYDEYGKDMIHNEFAEYEDRIAVGLVGQGSECFGFDDEVSKDHDYGAGFCMWLTDRDYKEIGYDLQKAYDKLPQVYMGVVRHESEHGGNRMGVGRIGDFYMEFIGSEQEPEQIEDWMRIPDHLLATATNGEIFADPYGEFTRIRKELLHYYPEDIRLKKLAAKAAMIAQSGQYNYSRMMSRGEGVSARLALNDFMWHVMSMTYLLNEKYHPFYKWIHKGMEDLTILPKIAPMMAVLAQIPSQEVAWENKEPLYCKTHLNTEDQIVVAIEVISGYLVAELKKQGLTHSDDNYLETHAYEIMTKIQDKDVKKLHVMEG